jgi:DNA/RNA endonuclease YhcR with UshA esterase domain
VRRGFRAVVVAAAVLSPVVPHAHHSFGGTYDVDKVITIKGTLAQITLRSPHSFLYVEVQDGDGAMQRWTVEGPSAAQFTEQFTQQGVKDAFKVGDPVEVVGNPSRSPNSTRARLIKITRTTDGKSWGSRIGETVN